MKRLIFVTTAIALIGAAQTSIPVSMISGPGGAGAVMVVTPTGQAVVAALGAGVTLTQQPGGAWVIDSAAAPARSIIGEVLKRQTDGTYRTAQAIAAGSLAVYRNGVRQAQGQDFIISAQAISPAPIAWVAADLVIADYRY